MKHNWKISSILIAMFIVTQLIGITIISVYSNPTKQITNYEGETVNVTLPYGLDPPKDTSPKINLISIIVAIFIAVSVMLILMNLKSDVFIVILRTWFFVVVIIALAITFYAALISIDNPIIVKYASSSALVISFVIAFFKVFKRNIIVHNISELMIYPGISVIFVPLLNIWTMALLLIVISIYDIYAVWHAGFMQKMAKYQISKVRVFSGFFVTYLGRKEKELVSKYNNMKSKTDSKLKNKKIKINIAMLGGGDVVFPLILTGVVLRAFGLFEALIISAGATIALGILFYTSEKGKFYPAMPFISAGCFVALGLIYLIN